ncbi:hypothetical protein [Micromonospora sp. WMMC273]|uniref:hypothetical protein n=1 Tax=Micromonospora sp. WMMC273 TaxID=3015157 RepID=UPI0022B6A504|nr:hypothetical protein [Micromonospora sp. WMMC273]MCZ7478919.1 hypothetical protein [Micromonospora sp. WMMC273]
MADYTDDEVHALAEVLTRARLDGVSAGSMTLARIVLDAGWRRTAPPAVTATQLARTALIERYGTIDPALVAARGGDGVEIGAAVRLARLDRQDTPDRGHSSGDMPVDGI